MLLNFRQVDNQQQRPIDIVVGELGGQCHSCFAATVCFAAAASKGSEHKTNLVSEVLDARAAGSW